MASGVGWPKRPPITSTVSAARVRPTPASTMPKLRFRAAAASLSVMVPVASDRAMLPGAAAGSAAVTVNVSTGSTCRSSSVGTLRVASVSPAMTVSTPAASAR